MPLHRAVAAIIKARWIDKLFIFLAKLAATGRGAGMQAGAVVIQPAGYCDAVVDRHPGQKR